MPLTFLLDEHLLGPLWKSIQRHNNQSENSIEAARVGDRDDLHVVSFLEAVAHASEAHEWRDGIHYIP